MSISWNLASHLDERIRHTDEQDQMHNTKLEQLRQDIRAGFGSGPAATWEPDRVKLECRARRVAKATTVNG